MAFRPRLVAGGDDDSLTNTDEGDNLRDPFPDRAEVVVDHVPAVDEKHQTVGVGPVRVRLVAERAVLGLAAGGHQLVLVLADQPVAGDGLEVADVPHGADVPPGAFDGEEAVEQELVGDVRQDAADVHGGERRLDAPADFVGMARKLRQADEPTVMQMYASGCSGNVTAGKYNDGSAENRPELARRLHIAMRDAWKKTQRRPLETCEFRLTTLQLPVRTSKGFSEQELQERMKHDTKPFHQSLAAMGLSWRKRVAAGQAIDVPAIDFGGPVLLLLPAESYVEFQLYAQSLRPNGFVVTVGYGECAPGYIPIERAWEENDGNLIDWCWVDPGCESRMKQAIETVLRRS